MHVGDMRMRVLESAVLMEVRMRLAGRFGPIMGVPMMFIVHMGMRMGDRLVLVLVSLGEMQPNTQSHESSCRQQLGSDRLSERHDRDERSQKGGGGEICPGARGAKVAQCQDKQRETEAIADEAHAQCDQRRRYGRQRGARPKRERKVDRAGNEALQFYDLQRVGQRDLAGQIIVQAPGNARAGDQERAEHAFDRRRSGPRRITAPAARQAMPSATRRSKFS